MRSETCRTTSPLCPKIQARSWRHSWSQESDISLDAPARHTGWVPRCAIDQKKWLDLMSDEKKKPLHPETNFLPPLKMILAFFDKTKKKKDASRQEDSDEKNVEKLIEKLSEKEEE